MKCAVKDCENHAHQGKFVGLLCAPCHAFVSGDGGLYSQAYRNSRQMIDTAIAMEREACAKVCENQKIGFPSYLEIDERIQECAAAIRERSNT